MSLIEHPTLQIAKGSLENEIASPFKNKNKMAKKLQSYNTDKTGAVYVILMSVVITRVYI